MTKTTTPKAEKPALRHAVHPNAKPTAAEIADVAQAEADKLAAAAEAEAEAEAEQEVNAFGLAVGATMTFEQTQAYYRARRQEAAATDEDVERVRSAKKRS